MEWKKFEDERPPEDVPVMVISKNWPDCIHLAVWHVEPEGWFWMDYKSGPINDPECYEFDDDYEYTHWMLLPMTPKGD